MRSRSSLGIICSHGKVIKEIRVKKAELLYMSGISNSEPGVRSGLPGINRHFLDCSRDFNKHSFIYVALWLKKRDHLL